MDMNTKAKEKVLQQLMDMMDERMVGDLKSKNPKFAKVDIQSDDPKLAESLKDKMMSGITDDSPEEEQSESPLEAMKENVESKETPEDDADMERLLEMYKKLK